MAQTDLKAELNPYDPPSKPLAYAAAIFIGVGIIVAIVLTALYGAGVFDGDTYAGETEQSDQTVVIEEPIVVEEEIVIVESD